MDKNFVAKVSDFGVSNLLVEGNRVGSSMAIDCFVDPEYVYDLLQHYEAKSITELDGFVDKALGNKKMDVVLEMLKLALLCLGDIARRPTMSMVVAELELIQRDEMYHEDNSLGEEFSIITLGSELFS
ncbi:hypothetical protein Syun_000980 [Stephania yunnanensis]|uniref:Protein kinase domain-containing protein n=1 Tax=Stephania yunnanensis TaxID=152371 RepID=A0AAP0LFR9_9MAGN